VKHPNHHDDSLFHLIEQPIGKTPNPSAADRSMHGRVQIRVAAYLLESFLKAQQEIRAQPFPLTLIPAVCLIEVCLGLGMDLMGQRHFLA
jgi:hypothetical protein